MVVQPDLCQTWSETPEGRFSYDAAQLNMYVGCYYICAHFCLRLYTCAHKIGAFALSFGVTFAHFKASWPAASHYVNTSVSVKTLWYTRIKAIFFFHNY